jgi:hypothetical protein
MAISGKHKINNDKKNQAENMNSLKRPECGRDSYISYLIDMVKI